MNLLYYDSILDQFSFFISQSIYFNDFFSFLIKFEIDLYSLLVSNMSLTDIKMLLQNLELCVTGKFLIIVLPILIPKWLNSKLTVTVYYYCWIFGRKIVLLYEIINFSALSYHNILFDQRHQLNWWMNYNCETSYLKKYPGNKP